MSSGPLDAMTERRAMADKGSQTELPDLGAELLAHTLREVRRSYEELNASLFRGSLATPTLEWRSALSVWGSWRSGQRVLSLNPRLVERGWGTLVEVLKHEMAHQYVEEILGAGDEGPHGSTFRRVCAERGIDAAATSDLPSDTPASEVAVQNPLESPELAVLRKIEGLLALAKSDNRHEAEVAMTKARRLMLRYNLSTVGSSRYSFRHIGKPTGRRMAWERALANLLSDYFFVSIIIVPVYRPKERKRGSVLEACGSPANLEMAAYVHDFLVSSAEALWRQHKREQEFRADRDRQSFLYGVMSGFSDKLKKETVKNQQEGLIWLGDPELDAYFRQRHPHVRQVSGRGRVQRDAFIRGHEAGGRIVLHRGVSAGHSSGMTRLLGSGEQS